MKPHPLFHEARRDSPLCEYGGWGIRTRWAAAIDQVYKKS